jgi:hypothetical protein
MKYYVLLGVATFALTWLTWRIWRKTHDLSFVLGLLLIYYWTLYGGWSIVTDGLVGTTTGRYYYLYDKLFPIELDHHYLLTLLLYASFAIGIALTVLLVAKDRGEAHPPGEPLVISHSLVIVMCAAAALFSYTIVRDAIQSSAELGQSAYMTTRGGAVGALFTLHQVLNRVAVLPAALGLAIVASGKNPKWIAGRGNQFHAVGYVAVLAGMYAFCIVLGNKNELFTGLLAGTLFYLVNARHPRFWLVGGAGLASFALIGAVDWLRGLPITGVLEQLNWRDLETALIEIGFSNEAFGAHFSLYGVLRFDVPLTYGASLISLAASIVPRVFWSDRPLDVYPHYAESVQAAGGQGYSLHHAAGWYLNFGIIGVLLGAAVWGWLWASLFNRFQAVRPKDIASRFFTILAPSLFVAGIPSLVRSGIEGYKGLAVDAFLVPIVCLALAHAGVASMHRVVVPTRRRRRQPAQAASVRLS